MRKLIFLLVASFVSWTSPAFAETTECMEITTIPVVITKQGIHCFKRNLGSSISSGNAIEIQVNNVTIDLNGYKLGGSAAGLGTLAVGIFAEDRKNITIRNGIIRGFASGIILGIDVLNSSIEASSGHLIEGVILDGNRVTGIQLVGTGNVVRKNRIVNTGPGSTSSTAIGLFFAGSSSLIVDNLVSNTDETGAIVGISVETGRLVELRNNSVLETNGGSSDTGIQINNTDDTVAINNRILNLTGTGNNGIRITGTSAKNGCVDNYVAGFATALSGCDYVSGNHTP